jgi:hypothetical protein
LASSGSWWNNYFHFLCHHWVLFISLKIEMTKQFTQQIVFLFVCLFVLFTDTGFVLWKITPISKQNLMKRRFNFTRLKRLNKISLVVVCVFECEKGATQKISKWRLQLLSFHSKNAAKCRQFFDLECRWILLSKIKERVFFVRKNSKQNLQKLSKRDIWQNWVVL